MQGFCEQRNATKPPSPKQPKDLQIRAKRILVRIYADLIGPIHPITLRKS